MKTWAESDLLGFFLVLFGVFCLIFSNSTWLTSLSLLLAVIFLLHSVYDARYEAAKFHHMLCHYQAVLSSSESGWIAWNSYDEYIGSSKKFRNFFKLKALASIYVADIVDAIAPGDSEDFIFYFGKLKKHGTPFKIIVTIKDESSVVPNRIEINGARLLISDIETLVLWCTNVTDTSSLVSSMDEQLTQARAEVQALHEILNVVPIPIWQRDKNLAISYCNRNYAESLDMDARKIVRNNIPLVPGNLFGQGHSLAEAAKKCGKDQSIAQFVVINGVRKKLSIHECITETGNFVGFAEDITGEENLASNLDRLIMANCEVLENVSSGIAIFGDNTRLSFFNSTFAHMMKLEPNWLHSRPTFSEILDELRNNRQIPEYADFQAFKKEQLALFTSITGTKQDFLHLPNGKSLRQMIAPYPLGGLVFVYEDITDSLSMQRKNNTLLAVQRETIEHLYEGIMVCGSDNRLKIINSALAKIWDMDPDSCKDAHLSEILDRIKEHLDYGEDWETFREYAISNLTDRIPKTGKLLKKDGSSILFSYVPLPDGAHMHSFIDVTDTCKVEKAILDKNQALKTAQRLRFEFITGFSTELKEPLNLLIGFAELLTHEYSGALNKTQMEYCQIILNASNQLHQLINNLLEMVSIDLESTKLDVAEFNFVDAVEEVVANLDKRAQEKNIDVVKNYAEDVPIFKGDRLRIKQSVFNIMLNAIQFSPPNGKINVMISYDDRNIKLLIKDRGIGAPKDSKGKIFRRCSGVGASFFGNGAETAGVSMPLVRSLIELHGGTINISSDIEGTSIICLLPLKAELQIAENNLENVEKVVNS